MVTTDLSYRALFAWHVPIFFFLSGAFWDEGRGMYGEWRARYRTLVRPYAAWLLLISLIAIPAAATQGPYAVVRRVGSIGLGGSYVKTPYTAFWFFSCLLFACLLTRWLRGLGVPWWVLGVIALTSTFLGPWLRFVPWSVGLALPCSVFVVAGRAYAAAPDWLRCRSAALAALTGGAVLVATGLSRPLFIKNGDFGVPCLGVVVAVLLCWGLVALCDRLPRNRITGRSSATVAKFGSAVVLAHGLPLDWFYAKLPTVSALIAVSACTAVLIAAVGRSRWSTAFFGR